ncbi:protein OXIDATIVE STRESS 3-like [Salvia miltiorrhiza]|uniref:protein OXIDATIVE STRESS 3-like n=1 Tax=Salvia miltiorrhiza TaxID=226208 RepID=UPI0025AD0C67|nr:protein OXIDATIVE STRESS 3-like [Salvia miltiorrhiza]
MEMELERSRQVRWADMKKDENCKSMESLSDSEASSSSSEDATTSSLFEFADLMAQLPIKRGLSKYYEGKSESFASLTSVESVEDLAKKEKRMKSCKSYGSNLNRHKFRPKATITKRSSPPLTFSPKPTNTMVVN